MIEPSGTGTATALVVGVTGHLELRDEDRGSLQAQVRSFFLDLRTRYPELLLVLLSRSPKAPTVWGGRRVRAWPARDVLLLPLLGDDADASIRSQGPARDRQYAEARMFVSRHCHILLALAV